VVLCVLAASGWDGGPTFTDAIQRSGKLEIVSCFTCLRSAPGVCGEISLPAGRELRTMLASQDRGDRHHHAERRIW
jgi:hypothetical protein